jgi:hypothetical protein
MIRKQRRISKMSNSTFTLHDNQLNSNETSHTIIIPPKKGDKFSVAIIQPGCWGDNINSTLMFKPLKAKYPDCQLDVYTTNPYASAFCNNPYIDHIISVDSKGKNECLHFMFTYDELLLHSHYDLKLNGSPLHNPGGWACKYSELGENLILSWANTLDHSHIDYDLPLETILQLTQNEINRADSFFENHTTGHSGPFVLMEIEGESGQSFWNHEWTESVCDYFILKHSATVFISRRMRTGEIESLQNRHNDKVIFAGDLSIRECAQLFNHCNAFFSVSSGLSNACNTNWCNKSTKWVEVTNSIACSSAPIRSEGKIFWHLNDLNAFVNEVVKTLF